MQLTVSEVKQAIQTLPREEKEEIRKWLNEQQPQNQNSWQADLERHQKSNEWLRLNREKYMNQWVCLDGDKLIAHGTNALEVDRQAKEKGIEMPFLEHIVEEKYPFGGW